MNKEIDKLCIIVFLLAAITSTIYSQSDPGYEANERGIAALNSGNYNQAILEFSEAIRLVPSNPYGYFNRGNVYFSINDFESAVTDFTQAIRIDANFILAYYHRGYSYMYQFDWARAITDFETVLRLNPDFPDAGESLSLARAMQSLEL